MKTYLYHRKEPARVFDTEADDMQALHDAGWRDTPAAFDSPEPDAAELNLDIPLPIPETESANSETRKKK